MLGGLDPILIFQFAKNIDPNFVGPEAPSYVARIPIISEIPTVIEQPPIPVYMSEQFTGLLIDSEDKNVDISTDVQTLSNGEPPDISQKGLSSTITINIVARKDSLSLALLSSLMDLCYDKVSAKEYSITYLHGPITIFRGVLHNFSMNQSADNELLNIKIELSKGSKTPTKPDTPLSLAKTTGGIP